MLHRLKTAMLLLIILLEVSVIFRYISKIYHFEFENTSSGDLCEKISNDIINEINTSFFNYSILKRYENVHIRPYYMWSRNRYLIYTLKPGFVGTEYYMVNQTHSKRFTIKVSYIGCRAENLNQVVNTTNCKILFLGDSHFFGWGLNYNETIPFVTKKKCSHDKFLGECDYINLAIPGYNLQQKIERAIDFVNKYNVTNITFFIVQYDGDDKISQYLFAYLNIKIPQELKKYNASENWFDYVDCIRRRVEEYYFLSVNEKSMYSEMIEEPLYKLFNFSMSKNVTGIIIVGYWPDDRDEFLIKKICNGSMCRYISVNNILKEPHKYYLSSYDRHFNYNANILISEAICEYLTSSTA